MGLLPELIKNCFYHAIGKLSAPLSSEPLDSYHIGIQNHTIRRPQSFFRNQLYKLCGVSFVYIPFCSESFKKYWLQSGSSSLQGRS